MYSTIFYATVLAAFAATGIDAGKAKTTSTFGSTCTTTPAAAHLPKSHCNVQGHFKRPDILSTGKGASLEVCASQCAALKHGCHTVSYYASNNTCTLYGKSINAMGFVADTTGPTISNIKCFTKQCASTSSSTTTIPSTSTSTVASSTSTPTFDPNNFQIIASGSGTPIDGQYLTTSGPSSYLPFTASRASAQNFSSELGDGEISLSSDSNSMICLEGDDKGGDPWMYICGGDDIVSCSIDADFTLACIAYDAYYDKYPTHMVVAEDGEGSFQLGMSVNAKGGKRVVLTAVPAVL